jgi:DNA modification methylase
MSTSTTRSFPSGVLLIGSCLDRLKELPDSSIDSIVTDPPYELSQDGKASAARVAAEVMFPQQARGVAKITEDDMLPFLLGKVAELGGVGVLPGEPTSMPVGAVALDDKAASRDHDVAHPDVATVRTSNGNRRDQVDAESDEHLGCFAFELADVEAGVDTLNRSGAGFLSGRLGVGLAVSPASLPGFLAGSGPVPLSNDDVRPFDDALAALVGAGAGAEELGVPHPFELGGRTTNDCSAFGTVLLLGLAKASGAKLVRAGSGARGLPSVLQPLRVRVVHGPTNRALTFDLLLHATDHRGTGFMGKAWDGSKIAYDIALWRECLRVLKPGGHLLAFGATRTYHRMTTAIEDAGFEIRDSIHWMYGSGFPKSLDVSKAIDKAAGAKREVVGTRFGVTKGTGGRYNWHTDDDDTGRTVVMDTAPATDAARTWAGWGTAMKPAHEPVVVARKPLTGTVAANVLEHGTGALNIDGCRVGNDVVATHHTTRPAGDAIVGRGAVATGELSTHTGRWPANVVFTHAADCVQVAAGSTTTTVSEQDLPDIRGGKLHAGAVRGTVTRNVASYADTPAVWECAPGCPVSELDRQSDGASRFFTVTEWDDVADAPFLYVAKPSKSERNAGTEHLGPQQKQGARPNSADSTGKFPDHDHRQTGGNNHPTVKPVALMRHLVRLVTPPNGTVLDPFLGSGTTAVAAVLEGFRWVGCEMTADYLPIIEGRVTWAGEQLAGEQLELFTPR